VVARFGGDEFVILLDLVGGLSEVVAVAGRIMERLEEPIEIQGERFSASASIGIALSDTGYSTVEEVLGDADSAMYRAKAEGRGSYRIFDPALQKAAAEAERVYSALQSSLERGEFRLHYQPLVDLASNRITGLEALLRWEHPELGTVPAGDFIAHAEDVGVILAIGRWVIREACRQLAAWREQLGPDLDVVVSVNLSSRELLDPTLVEWIRTALQETGAEPGALRVEIPESFLARRSGDVDLVLRELRELGIRIGIGDFGGSHSSLSHLHRSPVDLLKIDRRFVADLPSTDNEKGRANERAVRSILALAKSLGMQVVAAGVETQHQRELLRKLSCELGQGYLFSEPVEAAGAQDLLRSAWGADPESGPPEA
jgi:predicted signal transduction protein with EAL and GGDEF domain